MDFRQIWQQIFVCICLALGVSFGWTTLFSTSNMADSDSGVQSVPSAVVKLCNQCQKWVNSDRILSDLFCQNCAYGDVFDK